MDPTYKASPALVDRLESDPAFSVYWRRRSSTQDEIAARDQIENEQLIGGVPWGSSWPQAQAMRGRLPDDVQGVEFWCDVPTDAKAGEARWSLGPDEIPRPGVTLEAGKARVGILVTKCTQPI